MNNKEKNNSIDKRHAFKFQEVVILVSITCLFSFFSGMSMERVRKNSKFYFSDNEMGDEFQEFINVYNDILDNYYENIDENDLLDSAIKGMLDLLDDPYTTYMNNEDYDNMNITLDGNYKGLGVSIVKQDDGYIVVVSVFDNSPASKAGIQIGDIIKSVNDIDTKKLTTSEFSDMVINGDINEFNLVISRDDEEKELVVTKDNITIDSVTSKMYKKNNKKIGYIEITIFSLNTDKQFETKLKELEKEEIDSLIIDVRSNTGGHLSSVENIIGQLMDSSYVAYKLEKNGKITSVYSKGDKTKKYPIVILGDGMSASASEILIGSLKDNLEAVFIGTKTYGKGTVQELKNLRNGDQYKITTKKWLTPKGNWVNDTEGIEPDIEVKLDINYLENATEENDNQLQAAIDYFSN